ncbi:MULTISPECIES: DUF2917 domain-containing protein [Uliginosibacterium]|uniref:DUF2917 domain-containing protein n=1 Tax=Uliginosibacterium aquaticum TaxID=2731212 RepID=A0ABX2IHE9_9RHOO|nr:MULTISPECIES: DUF2917 domain-containing protein [Uliginosibacterium]MDO6386663.1 DUF2917 domain-containing protein [Uliginosibacterium sp. 31-12]NSL55717.1 DUF2917 domain-containing protein [Uliginosibacterium aquaticum]
MQDQITLIRNGELTVLEAAAGTLLAVLQGEVWLTEAGVAQDFVLQSGACHRVRQGGRVLIDAAGEARVQISRAGAWVAGPASANGACTEERLCG